MPAGAWVGDDYVQMRTLGVGERQRARRLLEDALDEGCARLKREPRISAMAGGYTRRTLFSMHNLLQAALVASGIGDRGGDRRGQWRRRRRREQFGGKGKGER